MSLGYVRAQLDQLPPYFLHPAFIPSPERGQTTRFVPST